MEAEKPTKPQWLAFRASPELAKRIDELAAAERRSRANWLRINLERLAQEQTTGDAA